MTGAPTSPQLSVSLPSFSAEDPGGWGHLRDRARDRRVGRASTGSSCSDHVVFGENLEAYADPTVGGTAGGKQPTGPDGHWLEPLTVARRTSPASRRASASAPTSSSPPCGARWCWPRQLATIDVLSGGRLDLGVGVGWQREEYEAAGLDVRGPRATARPHASRCARRCGASSAASSTATACPSTNIHMMPKPLQAGGVPIWVSGTVNARVVRRSPPRLRLDPVGPRRRRPGDLHPEDEAGRGRRRWGRHVPPGRGRAPVVAEGATLNLDATMEAAGPQLEAGVTG